MFSVACEIASQFTRPIIISHLKQNGECGAGIGAFVVINEEGWFVSAKHIFDQVSELSTIIKSNEDLLARRKIIEENITLKNHERINQLKQLKILPDTIVNFSVHMGWDNVSFTDISFLSDVDLVVGRLVNFDKTFVTTYPKFKDPAKNMRIGTSLCKLGYPFHAIVPTFQDGMFYLPPGSVPIPLFPLESIFTRQVGVRPTDIINYPLFYIETSSPGLRGQSGGPTFDIHGAIWAIQSSTRHFKLGFGADTNNSGKEAEHLKNQYLNVGWGIHSETLIGFLREKNISFELFSA